MEPSDAESWVTLERNSSQGWARIVLSRNPVNSMNLAVWQKLSDMLQVCEESPDIRGIIITSGLKRPVFTAGNDLNELYAPNTSRERYRRFWKVSNTFLCALYESPLLTVAAINGACPAGGCCISLCCDYRVMAEGCSMGLNEVALGIPVPRYWAALMARTVAPGVAEKLCAFAQMVSSQQALTIGMVDEVVAVAQVQSAAETAILAMLKLPDSGRSVTKQQARADFAAAWRAYLPGECEMGFTQLQDPETIKALGAVMQRLSGKRSRL